MEKTHSYSLTPSKSPELQGYLWCITAGRQRLNLLVRRAMGSDFHDVRLVLSQPRIDAQGVCLRTSVTDRDVVRG